jgi:hypothetical protein
VRFDLFRSIDLDLRGFIFNAEIAIPSKFGIIEINSHMGGHVAVRDSPKDVVHLVGHVD